MGGDAHGDRLYSVEHVIGSAHKDVIQGSGAANILSGGAGDDELWGHDGDDVLDGGEGSDTADYRGAASGVRIDLHTGAGAWGDAEGDVLKSIENLRLSNDHDFAFGSNEANRIEGLGGNDEIYALGGDDHVDGGAGGDSIDGNDGHDVIFGGAGDDRLLGGAGDDRLLGGAGDDRLEGGEGWDRLWGDEGKDVFVFKGGWGDDTINDFADGEDVIALDAAAYGALDQAIDNAVQNGADVVLAFDGGTITFANTNLANITHDDFRLAG
jgi:Ca2+-binding RTX toxin-like protein